MRGAIKKLNMRDVWDFCSSGGELGYGLSAAFKLELFFRSFLVKAKNQQADAGECENGTEQRSQKCFPADLPVHDHKHQSSKRDEEIGQSPKNALLKREN